MSDVKVEEKPKLDDITMEDASTTTKVEQDQVKQEESTVPKKSVLEEFAPQKKEDGELVIQELPEALKGKTDEEVAEVKKSIIEQSKSRFVHLRLL
jgi:hypothetical protein